MHRKTLILGMILLLMGSIMSPLSMGWIVEIKSIPLSIQKTSEFIYGQWSMYGYNAQNTCLSTYDASSNPGYEKWKFFIQNGLNLITPVIDNSGTLYVSSTSKGLFAIDKNGTQKWHHDLLGFTEYQPAISPDGNINVGTSEWFQSIYCNGTCKWILPIEKDFCSKPIINQEGVTYVGTYDGIFYAINSDGSLKWQYYIGNRIVGASIDTTENIYVSALNDDYLYCLNPNGSLNWKYETINDPIDAPLIGPDGTIYIVPIYDIIAINPDGTEKWRTPAGGSGRSPALAPDDTIIYSSRSGDIRALDPDDGHTLWQYEFPMEVRDKTRAAISADGTIFVAYTDKLQKKGYATALYPDGSLKWTSRLSSDWYPVYMNICPNPSIGADGTVYITTWFSTPNGLYSDFGYIHAFGDLPVNAPTSPEITGKNQGKAGKEYTYTLTSISPVDSDLFYLVDWGDNSPEEWYGPYPSGEPVVLNHTWSKKGNYQIQAVVHDVDNILSPWTTLEVQMPKTYDHHGWQWLSERFPLLTQILEFIFTNT